MDGIWHYVVSTYDDNVTIGGEVIEGDLADGLAQWARSEDLLPPRPQAVRAIKRARRGRRRKPRFQQLRWLLAGLPGWDALRAADGTVWVFRPSLVSDWMPIH